MKKETKKILAEYDLSGLRMEMPCQCDCGNWFDLNDGYPSKKNNKVICKECYNEEQK